MRSSLILLSLCCSLANADDSIRSRAVVDLSLDANDVVKDTRGKHPDVATVKASPQLISSPFWNQKGKALLLDAGQKQYIEVPDGVDVDCPNAASISMFFLSLHPLSDRGYHGVFAKRGPNNDARTNYGINYSPATDVFQLYIHDGPGFKVVQFGLKRTIGFSKLVHLTATFEVADAPGADADTDVDDVRVRLFVNGKAINPLSSSAGFVSGIDGWFTNVDVKKFLNDVPLTIGSSFGANELVSGVYDEFLLFNTALTPDDASKLFVELTGKTADEIAKLEKQQKRQAIARPTVKTMIPRGLQTGATTRVVVTGSMLKNSGLTIGSGIGNVKVVETAGNKLVADVTVSADIVAGFYPVRVHSKSRISDPVVVAIDRLPDFDVNTFSREKPAKLPVALSGVIGGTQEVRMWFRGKKGQRVVADVESKRLGSALDPVLEIKNERGTPLVIEWRKHELRGDTRAETKLPSDGLYYVELHDLSYRAAGNSPFRVRIGDLKVVDRLVVNDPETKSLNTFGVGMDANQTLSLEEAGRLDGPLPPVDWNTVEVQVVADMPPIDAVFKNDPQRVLAVNGIVGKRGEVHDIPFSVAESSKIYFTLKSRSIGSPLDGTLRVFSGNKLLAAKDSGGTGNDFGFAVTVPKGAKQLRGRVADFVKGGGATHGYRLLVSRNGRSNFQLTAKAGAVDVPENGSALLRLGVVRRGGGFEHTGPIRLSIDGDDGLKISPAELPQEGLNRDVFVTLSRTEPATEQIKPISIVAESTVGPPIRKLVRIPTSTSVLATESLGVLAVGQGPPVDTSISIAGEAPVLYRGTTATLPVQVSALSEDDLGTVRFRLMTTERVRDKKPLIRSLPNQFVTSGQSSSELKIVVPFDQVDPFVDVVVVGERVDNPFSPIPISTVYSAPMRLKVTNAVRVTPAPESLSLKIGETPIVSGKVERLAGFSDSIRLTITGLPKNYTAPPVVVPPDETTFAIDVTLPKDATPGALAKVQLVVQSNAGTTIEANKPLALKVVK